MPPRRLPPPALVLTFFLGLFFLVAAGGTWIPGDFVKDRYNEQFLPLMAHFTGEDTSATRLLAGLSQFIIGLVELTAAVLLLWGTFDAGRRLCLLKLGYTLLIMLFCAFMIVLFYLHDYSLPNWNQYPAMLAMLLLIWLAVEHGEKKRLAGE